MEQTLVLIKPDAIQRGLAGTIIARFEQRGLKIAAMKFMQVSKVLAEQHYGIHKDKAFFNDLVGFITSSPIIAIVFSGNNAVEIVRQSMGNTNSAQAAPGTIRGDFGLDIQNNLVHGSDSKENAIKEIDLFFSNDEILEYSKDIEKWVTGS
jgi:nucleoside-diphosphate kinase